MTTIQDVARAAGVAASTVSRYLNGQLRVSPATEAKVLEAVSELGYVPNAQARNLARRRSGVIGFVVPEISNPYFGAIADYVVEAVERHGRLVLLCSHRSQAVRQSSYIELLASGAIDGMLYLGSFRSNERLAAAIAGGLAVVVVDEPIAGLPPVHTVVMDDYAGGYQATSYLVALGPPPDRVRVRARPSSARCRSATAATSTRCARAGSTRPSRSASPGQFTEQFGMSALPHLLAAADPPTAAFVASDYIALGVLSAAETHGIRVPGGPVDRGLRRHPVQPVRAAAADHDQVAGRAAGPGRRRAAVRAAGRPGRPGAHRGAAGGAGGPGVGGPAGRLRSERRRPCGCCSAARAGSRTACTSRASTRSRRAPTWRAPASCAPRWPAPGSRSSTCPGTWFPGSSRAPRASWPATTRSS